MTLEIQEFDYADLCAIGSCTSLRTLVMDIVDDAPYWESDRMAAHLISLDALHELMLIDHGHVVCKAIAAPNLAVLSMSYGMHTPEYELSPAYFAQCIRLMLQRTPGRSGHPLQAMTMDASTFFANDDDYRDFLSVLLCAPSLKYLELQYMDAYYSDDLDDEPSRSIIRSLILRTDSSDLPVVPMLEHLKIDLCGAYGTKHAELLREIALSRWADDGGGPKICLTLQAMCRDACSCATRGSWQSELEAHGILICRMGCTDLPEF
ncbi:hypothetical protein BD626DRAFT_496842 [Schizophyllum amplum]|uniref:F-box domain-containing protein n=1 Tax=Schizophyllum amplum TaxID=97359 RepID=A0A550CDI3_9AGAR|nr:hypothetical protein BD626DRAFT_496842 [Auriculariopsis ampla]